MRAISPNLDWSYDRDDHYLADLAAFGPFYRSAGWTDAHIPRTERPVRFCYLSNAPESRPCIARGYMGYARPVRFPA